MLTQGSRFHCVHRYSAEIRNLHYLDFVLKLELLEGARLPENKRSSAAAFSRSAARHSRLAPLQNAVLQGFGEA
jgi:hypothetical protein